MRVGLAEVGPVLFVGSINAAFVAKRCDRRVAELVVSGDVEKFGERPADARGAVCESGQAAGPGPACVGAGRVIDQELTVSDRQFDLRERQEHGDDTCASANYVEA